MQPFAPGPGEFFGTRPTAQSPDAPLADDDRTGLRVLYPDADGHDAHRRDRGSRLAGESAGAALRHDGNIRRAGRRGGCRELEGRRGLAIGGWSCADPGPPRFDGSYRDSAACRRSDASRTSFTRNRWTGHSNRSDVPGATTALCRNAITDASWPAQFSCTVPAVNNEFSTKVRAGP